MVMARTFSFVIDAYGKYIIPFACHGQFLSL